MLLFAHTGITLGMAFAWDKCLDRLSPFLPCKLNSEKVTSLTRSIDYRIVLLGSMLPDIIDKPIGHLLFPDTFENNGRIFAHTLLFFMLIMTYGLFRFYQYGKNDMLVLALCSGFHLILDGMWMFTRTLFWPLMGWQFPSTDLVDLREWLESMGDAAKTEPVIYVTETIGLVILTILAVKILKNKSVLNFIKRGTIQ